jgi:nitrogen fixation protein FixH
LPIRFASLIVLSLAALTSQAFAQSWKGPNGGQMVDAGGFHVELIVRNAEYRVNVFDHVDNPVAVAQATAIATVMAGEDKEKVTLQPVAANALAGKGTMKVSGAVKVLVLLRVPDQATAMARFELQ